MLRLAVRVTMDRIRNEYIRRIASVERRRNKDYLGKKSYDEEEVARRK